MRLWWSLVLLVGASSAAAAGLGTSAALDPAKQVWIAYAQSTSKETHVELARFDANANRFDTPLRVNTVAEPVAADGENRPKLAFGPRGEIYVTWTSPTSDRYTGDVRFARSLDGGATWSTPIVVHRDRQRISHRFESLIVDGEGRVFVAWLDKRDLVKQGPGYAGAALYYAYSEDRGETWHGDFKVADHSCECCRIALTLDPSGRPLAMWRHVFAPNERDHAVAVLTTDPRSHDFSRVTSDRWAIDACPHHGPSIAIDGEVRHAVWFNQIEGEGRVFYGQLAPGSDPTRVRALPRGATHADVATAKGVVVVAWKRYDGSATLAETLISRDRGATFETGPVLRTQGDSDQPRLLSSGDEVTLVWRQAEGTEILRVIGTPSVSGTRTRISERSAAAAASATDLRPFAKATLKAVEDGHRGRPFWLILWDLECGYCMKSLQNVARAQQEDPELSVVTVATDPLNRAEEIVARLHALGVRSRMYAFDGASQEALRYAIDPTWAGEKPRAYRYGANGERKAVSGVLSVDDLVGR